MQMEEKVKETDLGVDQDIECKKDNVKIEIEKEE